MESPSTFVRPVRPVAPYIGGKRHLAAHLVDLIDRVDCVTYAEPFIGMGGVFLRRRRRPEVEVINDLNEDVATFFRILQRHYVAFMDMLRFQLTTRAGFDRLIRTDATTLTDLERAARFLYLQRTAFGGKVVGQNFGVTVTSPGRFDMTKLSTMLEDLHERLAGVIIERLPYGDFIERYDRPKTLFYLDPPYWDSEGDYGVAAFGRADFALLAEQLGSIAGRFILSINDTPGARDVFARFRMDQVKTIYTLGAKHVDEVPPASELVISNFKIEEREPQLMGL